jgi:hypothetical protein
MENEIKVICRSFKHAPNKSLLGYAVLEFPEIGLRIFDVGYIVPESETQSPFISWPSRQRDPRDASKGYRQVIEAQDRDWHFRLEAACVKAIQSYIAYLTEPNH